MTAPDLTGRRLRPGGSWATRGGLTTLVDYDPAEPADDQGRRQSDVNAGTVLTPALAEEICDVVNAVRRQTEADPLTERDTVADLPRLDRPAGGDR